MLVLEHPVLGVDIGGSSIKFCLFDSENILKHCAKQYARTKNPESILEMIRSTAQEWDHAGNIGIGFPGLIKDGVVVDAPNLDGDWEGYNLPAELTAEIGAEVRIINDADAAALGMAKRSNNWENIDILCLTLGTGIGSAWLRKGQLESGTEYGRMFHSKLGCSLEQWASVRTMNHQELSINQWADRLCTVLEILQEEFKPDQFLLSGGITTGSIEWLSVVRDRIQVPVSISEFGDLTGAVGAAKLHSV